MVTASVSKTWVAIANAAKVVGTTGTPVVAQSQLKLAKLVTVETGT